jgi:site-specific DNA-methyltransferase (adenine-specific)
MKTYTLEKITLHHRDCVEAMREMDDDCFDLAIVDPPYGMKAHGAQNGGAGWLKDRAYNVGKIDSWDIAPPPEYFEELMRVSKNQIIWGGNYFDHRYAVKIHPTQKPVELYEWLLGKFANKGDKILDTHFGSGSHGIACHNMGYELTAYEVDGDFIAKTVNRIQRHQLQLQLPW